MKHRALKNIQKYILLQTIFGQIKTMQTTICPFTIVPRRNRLVHRRYLVKSKLCNVTDLSALYQAGFSQHCRYHDVAIALIRGIDICNWLSGLLNDLARPIWRWMEKNRVIRKENLRRCWVVAFFRPTPGGSRQVVYQAGKTIAFCKFTELMQWQHQS